MAHAAAINSLMPAIAAAGPQTNADATAVAAAATTAAGATNVAVNANSSVVASDEHNFASVSMLFIIILFIFIFIWFPFLFSIGFSFGQFWFPQSLSSPFPCSIALCRIIPYYHRMPLIPSFSCYFNSSISGRLLFLIVFINDSLRAVDRKHYLRYPTNAIFPLFLCLFWIRRVFCHHKSSNCIHCSKCFFYKLRFAWWTACAVLIKDYSEMYGSVDSTDADLAIC